MAMRTAEAKGFIRDHDCSSHLCLGRKCKTGRSMTLQPSPARPGIVDIRTRTRLNHIALSGLEVPCMFTFAFEGISDW
ncbi:Hypothetical predicted protein [Cloeon dipterum]|uniref:Uncharacterized protein n=1 Tax=Cloeon dipterum TaxID=197152 RepID=A0A8S1C123_9INSE|nr:Hypothetical predicted protein [Cloeon dipterum]